MVAAPRIFFASVQAALCLCVPPVPASPSGPAVPPRLDSVLVLPTGFGYPTPILIPLGNGDYAAGIGPVFGQTEIAQFGPSGEKTFHMLMGTDFPVSLRTLFPMPDDSYVAAGPLGKADTAGCEGAWIARFRDRRMLWFRPYCNDSTGYIFNIEKGAALDGGRMLFAGAGKNHEGKPAIVFLETDGQGAVLGKATTPIPDVHSLYLPWYEWLDGSDRILAARVDYNKDYMSGAGSVPVLLRFDDAFRLSLLHPVEPRDRFVSGHRLRSDGAIDLIGTTMSAGADTAWFRRIDASGSVLADTLFPYPPSGGGCVADDALGMTLAYNHSGNLRLLKLDSLGRVVYHAQYDTVLSVYLMQGMAPDHDGTLRISYLVQEGPGIAFFDVSGAGCAPTIGIRARAAEGASPAGSSPAGKRLPGFWHRGSRHAITWRELPTEAR